MQPLRTNLPQPTDRILLGSTELLISPFCLGLVRSPETVCAAFDSGINFFFLTADMHWPLYENTRKGLKMLLDRGKHIRDEIVIGVASYVSQSEFTVMPFLEVLEDIPTLQKIDVAIIGGAYGNEFMSRLQTYEENHRQNRVPFTCIGASFHDRKAAVSAMNHHMVELALVRYNPRHPGAVDDLFPHLSENRKTLLFNFNNTVGYVSPQRCHELGVDKEYWHPNITDFYRFALTRKEVNGLLCSLETPKQITALREALNKGPLDSEEENYLINLAALDAGQVTLDV